MQGMGKSVRSRGTASAAALGQEKAWWVWGETGVCEADTQSFIHSFNREIETELLLF